MQEKTISVYSKKHDINAQIVLCGNVYKLLFTYDGKDLEIGLQGIGFNSYIEEMGEQIIDMYIEKIHANPTQKKTMMFNWYFRPTCVDENSFCLCGNVVGHKRLVDSLFIHTSPVIDLYLDFKAEEVVVVTKNTVYHCPLSEINFRKYEKHSSDGGLLPDYDQIKEKYQGKKPQPTIEDGKVLLVLSDQDSYYFDTLICNCADGTAVEWTAHPHIGTFQDSFLISGRGTHHAELDICYFPHFHSLEFYSMDTGGRPLFIENVGKSVLYAETSSGQIRLEPGERKEVTAANAEPEEIILPDGDLYPAEQTSFDPQ